MIRDGIGDTLGKRICYLRKQNKLTQEELAEVLCVKKSTISMYENDKVDIKGSILVELSKALNTTPNYLLGLDESDEELSEVIAIFKSFEDPGVRKLAMTQIRVLSSYINNK